IIPSTTVYELKRIVEGILKRPPEDQRLYKDDQLLDESKSLGDCGFTMDLFSSPPELPDVMKPQETSGSANEQSVQ
uniref:Elongin B n=1 Tax=Leptobrachium leishanense TaxID=445787 RepID=A0A8C5MTZ4_9ANUR